MQKNQPDTAHLSEEALSSEPNKASHRPEAGQLDEKVSVAEGVSLSAEKDALGLAEKTVQDDTAALSFDISASDMSAPDGSAPDTPVFSSDEASDPSEQSTQGLNDDPENQSTETLTEGEEGPEEEEGPEGSRSSASQESPDLQEKPTLGTTPQSGVLAGSNLHGYYITYTLRDDDYLLPYVQDVLARFPSMLDECARVFDVPSLSGSVAIGADAWERLYPAEKPIALKPFPAMKQGERSAPETPCDLFFQIRCDRQDINFVVAQRVHALLGELTQLQEAVPTFRYLDSRDLTGFVDGTENPQGEDKARVAIVGPEDACFSGGSYVHIQRFIHNLPAWNKLDVPEQEHVIGRTKSDNVEFTGSDKPLTSHIKRSGIKDEDGKPVEILRQSMPYGNLEEQGLYFVSYCRFADNFTRMLASMIYSDAKGHYDHLMKYTRAVTGAALFAPAREFLTQYLGAAAEAEKIRAQIEAEEAARLAAEEAERNSTRGELKYTPLSESADDAVIPVRPPEAPAVDDLPMSTEPTTPQPVAEPPAQPSGKRYSATFYQAMIEDDEKEREQDDQAHIDISDDGLKNLQSLPWSLTDEGKNQKKQDD